MKIAVGADFGGFELKEAVCSHLKEQGHTITDYGTLAPDAPVEYYDIVPKVAPLVQNNEVDRAILFCGTGMGMAQIANSYRGIRAAVCESVYAARLCRVINNSNILSMGGFLVAPHLGCQMADVFLGTQMTDGFDNLAEFLKDAQKKITALEEKIY